MSLAIKSKKVAYINIIKKYELSRSNNPPNSYVDSLLYIFTSVPQCQNIVVRALMYILYYAHKKQCEMKCRASPTQVSAIRMEELPATEDAAEAGRSCRQTARAMN